MQEEPWQHSRRVWYVHADGIQAGTILPSTAVTNTSSSTVLLRLDNGQRMIEVDEYDTEPVSAHYLLECDNGDFICFSLRRDTSFNAGGSLVFLPFFGHSNTRPNLSGEPPEIWQSREPSLSTPLKRELCSSHTTAEVWEQPHPHPSSQHPSARQPFQETQCLQYKGKSLYCMSRRVHLFLSRSIWSSCQMYEPVNFVSCLLGLI